MDFDEINDLVNELKPEKQASEKAEDIGVVSSNNAHSSANIQLAQANVEREDARGDQNEDAFANERENSDCGTS